MKPTLTTVPDTSQAFDAANQMLHYEVKKCQTKYASNKNYWYDRTVYQDDLRHLLKQYVAIAKCGLNNARMTYFAQYYFTQNSLKFRFLTLDERYKYYNIYVDKFQPKYVIGRIEWKIWIKFFDSMNDLAGECDELLEDYFDRA